MAVEASLAVGVSWQVGVVRITVMTLANSALLLIEFQREWLGRDGKLRHRLEQPRTNEAMENAARALAAARMAQIVVLHSGMFLSTGYPELRGVGPARFGMRAAVQRAGTWQEATGGSDFVGPFVPRPDERVIRKSGSSAFIGTGLQDILKDEGVTVLYLAGFALHVCVESTARDAHDLGYNAIVLSDAVSAFTPEQRNHSLTQTLPHFAGFADTDEFIAAALAS